MTKIISIGNLNTFRDYLMLNLLDSHLENAISTWDGGSGSGYLVGQIVKDAEGNIYICKKKTDTGGNAQPLSNTTYWGLLVDHNPDKSQNIDTYHTTKVVHLRKNIVTGVNTTNTLVASLIESCPSGTIFIIDSVFTYCDCTNSTITFPADSIIVFLENGAIRPNGTFNIVGNNTTIVADRNSWIFNNVNLLGSWNSSSGWAYPEWFGSTGDSTSYTDFEKINKALNIGNVKLLAKSYFGNISTEDHILLRGQTLSGETKVSTSYGYTITLTLLIANPSNMLSEYEETCEVIRIISYSPSVVENLTISGGIITEDTVNTVMEDLASGVYTMLQGIAIGDHANATINNVKLIGFGSAITIYGLNVTINNVTISNCYYGILSPGSELSSYTTSLRYVKNVNIDNITFHNCLNSTIRMIKADNININNIFYDLQPFSGASSISNTTDCYIVIIGCNNVHVSNVYGKTDHYYINCKRSSNVVFSKCNTKVEAINRSISNTRVSIIYLYDCDIRFEDFNITDTSYLTDTLISQHSARPVYIDYDANVTLNSIIVTGDRKYYLQRYYEFDLWTYDDSTYIYIEGITDREGDILGKTTRVIHLKDICDRIPASPNNFTLSNSNLSPDTTYILQDATFIIAQNITIPSNCALVFGKNSLIKSTSSHIITGSDTYIKAPIKQIFEGDIAILGTWNVAGEYAYAEWFGDISELGNSINHFSYINNALKLGNVKLISSNYICGSSTPVANITINIPENRILNGNGAYLEINKVQSGVQYPVINMEENSILENMYISVGYGEDPSYVVATQGTLLSCGVLITLKQCTVKNISLNGFDAGILINSGNTTGYSQVRNTIIENIRINSGRIGIVSIGFPFKDGVGGRNANLITDWNLNNSTYTYNLNINNIRFGDLEKGGIWLTYTNNVNISNLMHYASGYIGTVPVNASSDNEAKIAAITLKGCKNIKVNNGELYSVDLSFDIENSEDISISNFTASHGQTWYSTPDASSTSSTNYGGFPFVHVKQSNVVLTNYNPIPFNNGTTDILKNYALFLDDSYADIIIKSDSTNALYKENSSDINYNRIARPNNSKVYIKDFTDKISKFL